MELNLMKGDLVKQNFTGLIIKVSEIYNNYIVGENKDDGQYSYVTVEPIPITENILKMNNFIYCEQDATNEYSEWHIKDHPNFALHQNNLSDGVLHLSFGPAKIKYVHEVQDCLRLCGLNDIANNFKIERIYTYEDEIRITSEFLNKIDILQYIKNNKDKGHYTITNLQIDLENDFEDTGKVPNDDFFEGVLFNRMNESEFEDYLYERYKTKLYFAHIETTDLRIK